MNIASFLTNTASRIPGHQAIRFKGQTITFAEMNSKVDAVAIAIKPLITISVIYTVVSMSVFSLNEVIVYIQGKMFATITDALTNGYGYVATLAWVYFIVMALIILIFVGVLNIRGRKAK